jgi:hypothetical protein
VDVVVRVVLILGLVIAFVVAINVFFGDSATQGTQAMEDLQDATRTDINSPAGQTNTDSTMEWLLSSALGGGGIPYVDIPVWALLVGFAKGIAGLTIAWFAVRLVRAIFA